MSKRPGKIVQYTDKEGTQRTGYVYNDKGSVNGKVPVYDESGANPRLVSVSKLVAIGFFD